MTTWHGEETAGQIAASIRRMGLVLLGMLAALAIITGYWQVIRGPALAAREDNPRLVIAERRIPRGAILDRNGRILAFSQLTSDGYARHYTDQAAEPVVGYYSLRYGAGGIEATLDDELRGAVGLTRWDTLVNNLLHRIPAGRSVRLTLDLSAQRAAHAALGERSGAAVVLSIPEGEVIALASRPTFDPTALDQDWERLRADPASPLLNRATQGLYQPGAAFQVVVLAQALSRGLVHLTDTVPLADAPVQINSASLRCATSPVSETLAAAFAAGCPAPFVVLADQLDAQSLVDAIHLWRLDGGSDQIELPSYSAVFTLSMLTDVRAVHDLVLGQGSLTISPLRMAFIAGTIANDGQPIAAPHLTSGFAYDSPTRSILSSEIARAIQTALSVYGDLAGQSAQALGGENRFAWFWGFAPVGSPRWAIVVLLENDEATTARAAAVQVRAALSP